MLVGDVAAHTQGTAAAPAKSPDDAGTPAAAASSSMAGEADAR
jgi:hypothetical protein